MCIKIVVVDAGLLPPSVEFPPLEIPKYGWEEYPGLDEEGMVELLAFPDAYCVDPRDAQDLCNRITQAIDHYVARGAKDRTYI